MVENSSGIPPASATPRLTAAARPRKWMLQWTSSDHGLHIPTTGRSPNGRSAGSDARWMKPARSWPPSQRRLRKARESGIARIYVTGAVPQAVADALAESFELLDAPDGADGLLTLLTTDIGAAYLDRAGPQLRVVANYAVGVNNIELQAAREPGI